MALQSYFPTAEAERIVWLGNFRSKIATHGPNLGLSAAEITDLQADLAYYLWLLQTWNPAVQHYAQAATAYKNLIAHGEGNPALPALTPAANMPPPRPAGVLSRTFAQIARLKTHPGFSEAIGRDLGVIAMADTAEHPFPEFTVSVETGAAHQIVRLNFTKYGHDGVWIESRRGGGEWEFLAVDTVKPYLDERPLLTPNTAETREYRLRWWDKGEAHGDWSPVQSLAVGV